MNKIEGILINEIYACLIRFDAMLSLLFLTAFSKPLHAKINNYYVFLVSQFYLPEIREASTFLGGGWGSRYLVSAGEHVS